MAEPAEALIDDADLPPTLAEIRDVIGLAATLRLVEAYGGITLRVPWHFDPAHPLVSVIGHAAAAALIERFAGERVYIARLAAATRALRNIEISQRFEAGTRVETLARDYHLSVRQIWNILKDPATLRTSPAQTDLFGSASDDATGAD